MSDRWWLLPGEGCLSLPHVPVRVTYLGDDGTCWEFAAQSTPGEARFRWHHQEGRLIWPETQQISETLRSPLALLCEKVGAHIRPPDAGTVDRTTLEAVVTAAAETSYVSGRRVRAGMPHVSSEQFSDAVSRLAPRFLSSNHDPHNESDFYTATFTGLVNSNQAPLVDRIVQATLELLRDRFRQDPDFSRFTLDEVFERGGFAPNEKRFVNFVIGAAHFGYGGSGSDTPGSPDKISFTWGTPPWVETLVRMSTTMEYLACLRAGFKRLPSPTSPMVLSPPEVDLVKRLTRRNPQARHDPGQAKQQGPNVIDFKEKLGEGAFGEVWRAKDIELQRDVAVKLFKKTDDLTAAALDHARALARVTHRNVVRVYSITSTEHPETKQMAPCVVMELIEGVPLSEFIKSTKHRGKERILAVGQAIIDGVAAIHNAGIPHGDLHADNIIVTAEDASIIDMMRIRTYLHTADLTNLIRWDVRDVRKVLSDLLEVADLPTDPILSIDKDATLDAIAAAWSKVRPGNPSLAFLSSSPPVSVAAVSFSEARDDATAMRRTEPIGLVLRDAFQQITTAAMRGDRITGISTGYERLDAKTAGLHSGDLTIVAARPGVGKTSFVLNLAVNVASPRAVTGPDEQGADVEWQEQGFGVCLFSLEMPRDQLGLRMACAEGRVDFGKVRQGFLEPNEWRRLTEAASFMATLPIWIDDTPALGIAELRIKVQNIQAKYNREASATTPERKVGLVVVDCLQLMKGREGGVQSREQQLSELSRGLKQLAKELAVPVVALSQLNAAEARSSKNKRPQLSDLRESGTIEEDADTIILIHRDDGYSPGIAEFIIAKQRNGPTGKILVRFAASYMRFDNLSMADYPEAFHDE